MNENMTGREPRAKLLLSLPLLLLCEPGLASFRPPGDPPSIREASELERGLRDEAARLMELIATPQLRDEMNPQVSGRVTKLLGGCETSLGGGRALEGLRRLARARLEIERTRYQLGYADVKDQGALDQRCVEALEEVRRVAARESESPRPASVQALIEVCDGRAGRYITSGAVQGAATRIDAGIYYLSLGRSYADLGGFVRSLECAAPANPVQELPGLESYLDRLDAELVDLYKPPLSISRHPEFIATSATLKLARQLYEEDAILGALELALETRSGLGRLHDRSDVDAEWLQSSLEDHARALAMADVDHSLGRMLLGRAQNFLSGQLDPDTPETQGETAVLLAEALPEYFACFSDESGPALEPAEVTVTLVRWPFT